MTITVPPLAALIGSRICHDLVSPIGAISNGLELIELSTSLPATPEFDMLRESCDNANARLRHFRIAFGQSTPGQTIARRELRDILTVLSRGTRFETRWDGPEQISRAEAQTGLLAAMCLETALPRGGSIQVCVDDDRITAQATGNPLRVTPDHWDGLTQDCPPELGSSHVQFLMLRNAIRNLDQPVSLDQCDSQLTVEILTGNDTATA